ncbi:DUF4892 domain-containing protein [Pseudomonas sp. Marseille-QA0892]
MAVAASNAADKAGGKDLDILPRFQHSEIVDYRNVENEEKRYPLGPIRRIGGQLRYEGEVIAQGGLNSITYRVPSEYRATDSFEYARETLLSKGGQLLYWCVARDCGSSSLWANTVFGRSSLYGPDDGQAYAILRLEAPGERDRLVALYSITRGNRQAYLQVEQLTPAEPIAELLPNPATLLRQLREDRKLVLPETAGPDGADWSALVTRALRMDSTLRVVLNGPQAAAWREMLVSNGIRQGRIEVDDSDGDAPGLEVRVIR